MSDVLGWSPVFYTLHFFFQWYLFVSTVWQCFYRKCYFSWKIHYSVSQKFFNILAIWGTVWQLQILLPKLRKEWNKFGLCNAELTWYSPSATYRVCLYSLEHSLGIYSFWPIWTCLRVKVFATLLKPCIYIYTQMYIYIYIYSKVGDHSRGWPEGSLFDSYYTKV